MCLYIIAGKHVIVLFMSPSQLPTDFTERLQKIVPQPLFDQVLASFDRAPAAVVRVNTLKISLKEVIDELTAAGIAFNTLKVMPEALDVGQDGLALFDRNGFFEKGFVYCQSLSSMLAVKALDPHPDENILDLCAAPGSKTSQTAARMNNQGSITAVEAVRGRFYKLKSVLNLLGVENTTCVCLDGRRFRAREELFDRVLVDAPCSSEGRFNSNEPETFRYWSLRKIREMVQKQRGLLLNAGRLLKNNGVMIYSTCTFAPEENEGVVNWFLKKTGAEFAVEQVDLGEEIEAYPAVMAWGKKEFDPQIRNCSRILPAEKTEGFFIARLRKNRGHVPN